MKYSINDIAQIINAEKVGSADFVAEHLLIDSRKIVFPAASLFFALPGPRRDGHDFISEVYERGVRAFVVSNSFPIPAFKDAVFLKVEDVLKALQLLAAYHRKQFNI